MVIKSSLKEWSYYYSSIVFKALVSFKSLSFNIHNLAFSVQNPTSCVHGSVSSFKSPASNSCVLSPGIPVYRLILSRYYQWKFNLSMEILRLLAFSQSCYVIRKLKSWWNRKKDGINNWNRDVSHTTMSLAKRNYSHGICIYPNVAYIIHLHCRGYCSV